MENNMNIFLARLDEKLDEKLAKQTATLTTLVTTKVMEALDEKLKLLTEENTELKNKVNILEQKLNAAEKDKRKHNLVFFGVEERGKRETELVDYIKDIVIETETQLECHEIENIYRIGQRSTKNRPVVVTITSIWKKHMILKNKAKLPPGINVKEDLPKEVLEKRRQLQTQLVEEREKGNFAYFNYDKLIIKKNKENTREKRKRDDISPNHNSPTQKKVNTEENNSAPSSPSPPDKTPREILRPNILNYVDRTQSLPELPKN